jgi:radical SAM-linked protein
MPLKYRIKYSKRDGIKFISHLDVMQLFSRAARRGHLPLAYSEGFNPRPQIVFGMPLPVGVTSEAEYADMEFNKAITAEELISELNDVLPEGVRVLEAKELPEGTSNIMKSVRSSQYLLKVTCEGKTPLEIFTGMKAYLDTGQALFTMKRSKSGEKETDIRPMIYDFTLRSQEGNNLEIETTVSAGNEANLRPELVIAALSEQLNCKATVTGIHRLNLM